MTIRRNYLIPSLLLAATIFFSTGAQVVRASGGVMEIPPAPTTLPVSGSDNSDQILLNEPAQQDATDHVAEAALSLVQTLLLLL